MITTIIGVIKFKEDHVLINSILGVLKTEGGPLDLTLSHGVSRVSLRKGTLQIRYDSTVESKLDNMGILGEVETFNKQFPTVVQGYRNELFKFDSLPKGKDKLDWLAEMKKIKFNLMEHVIKCVENKVEVDFKLTNSIGLECVHVKGVVIDWSTSTVNVQIDMGFQTKIPLDNIISLTYGG